MTPSFEVEQKFHIDDLATLELQLAELGGCEEEAINQTDTYFNHPSRDFAQTQEAFRIRRVDGAALITYKGTKLPGAIKARRELEWNLGAEDSEGRMMEQLLELLSFRRVAVVQKRRRPFSLPGELADFSIVIDDVAGLGNFAEVELIADDAGKVEAARQRIGQLSQRLGLHQDEPRSYLRMLLDQYGPNPEHE